MKEEGGRMKKNYGGRVACGSRYGLAIFRCLFWRPRLGNVRRMFVPPARRAGICALLVLLVPLTASAGMPHPMFTDIAQARLQVLSFFLILYLGLALLYQWIWNSLVKDFPKLPRIRFRGALGMLTVCGLFIYVVLTMISGARELMTPGAWARNGVGYKLREPEKDPKPWLDVARRGSLERLRAFLWHYSEQHGGAFPTSREQEGIASVEWNSIDPTGLPLIYMPGLKPDIGKEPLAWEPASFGPTRFVLLSSGEVVQMKEEELTASVQKHVDNLNAAISKKAGHE